MLTVSSVPLPSDVMRYFRSSCKCASRKGAGSLTLGLMMAEIDWKSEHGTD